MKSTLRPLLASALVGAALLGGQAHAAGVDATKMLDLARSSGCLACHALDHAKVGPSYAEIARRYQGRPDAVHTLQQAILNGHSGSWGLVPMPAYGGSQDLLTAAQARDLARWVLSQAGARAAP